MSVNPVGLLEPSEKPRWRPGHVAVLEGDDLARVLDHAGSHRSLFELLAYVGEHGTCREIATKSAEAISVSRA